MKDYLHKLKLLVIILVFIPQHSSAIPTINDAYHNEISAKIAAQLREVTLIEERAKRENNILPNSFAIAFYKPTYILPYYYTGSPFYSVYRRNTPGNEKLSHSELKYQLSFKVPIWKNIFNYRSTLNLAYTQLSYWQAYNHTAFFRETDYEPELFIANEVNFPFFKAWHINFFNVGAVHQSNGFGGRMERSWNRIYAELISSADSLMVSIKPWVIIHDSTMRDHNPNIANFLGYGQLLIAFKYHRQVFSIQAHNLIENGAKRITGELTWSFPINPYFNGYLQFFTGYGQSLIEYNHRTTSGGFGIALSNWV